MVDEPAFTTHRRVNAPHAKANPALSNLSNARPLHTIIAWTWLILVVRTRKPDQLYGAYACCNGTLQPCDAPTSDGERAT